MKNTIINYLHNEISEDELRQLKHWLKEPKNQLAFKKQVRHQILLDRSLTEVDANVAYQKLLRQIGKEEKASPKTIQFPNWLKYAAVFVGIIGLGYGLFDEAIFDAEKPTAPQITLQLGNDDLKVVHEKAQGIVAKIQGGVTVKQERDKLVYSKTQVTTDTVVSYNTLNVPYGKQFEVELTDGTRIILNAGSTLTYPTFFLGEGNRNVQLAGEAFFVVAEDASRPFVVHTEKMKIRVLGTEFNVSSYRNDKKTTAVLASGKIAATAAKREFEKATAVILSPGEMASYQEGKIEVSNVNVEKHTAWISGKLMFINDPFEVIANKLERHYDVEIINHCANLKKTVFTGTFESKDINKVLRTFQIHTPFSYKKEGNKIVISACGE